MYARPSRSDRISRLVGPSEDPATRHRLLSTAQGMAVIRALWPLRLFHSGSAQFECQGPCEVGRRTHPTVARFGITFEPCRTLGLALLRQAGGSECPLSSCLSRSNLHREVRNSSPWPRR